MAGYSTFHFDPPAPVAKVILRAGDGMEVDGILMLLDTGADTTLLPRSAIARLGITPDPSLGYERMGFDGNRSTAQAVDLDMIFLQKAFRGRYLVRDSDYGIVGRAVLASVASPFDGPDQEWSQKTA